MASVTHVGLFPWCNYANKEKIISDLALESGVYEENINFFEGLLQPISVAVKWYWRVKKWRVIGYFDAKGPFTTIRVNYQYTFIRGFENEELFNSEKELVCFPRPLIRQEPLIEFSHPDFGIHTMQDAYFDIGIPQIPFGLVKSGLLSSNNNIYNWVSLIFGGEAAGELNAGIITPVQYIDSSVKTPTTYSITALGQTYTGNTYKKDPSLYEVDAGLSIDAIEYWPYDPQDGGGPIYNTSTGARLRANPQI